MRAVRLHAAGQAPVLEELPLAEPVGTQVRVRVAGCGICRTDLHIVRGAMTRVELPLTLGHEIAGWIEAVGEGAVGPMREARLAPGDPVLVFGGWGCGTCRECRTGNEQRCAIGRSPGFQEDGGYAEAVLVPHPRQLIALQRLDPSVAGPLADAGATPYRAVRRAAPWLGAGARAVVLGAGGLGQFAIQYLRRGPLGRLVVVEPDPDRRATSLELGADAAVADVTIDAVRDALDGEPNAVLDLVGSDETLAAAGTLVAPGGLVMLVGEAGGHASFGFRTQLESWWTTTAWASPQDLREVVALAERGELRWQTEAVPLAGVADALERLAAGEVAGRLVVVPGGNG